MLKLKDWPTTHDFKEKLPLWFDEFMSILPLKSYTWRSGMVEDLKQLNRKKIKIKIFYIRRCLSGTYDLFLQPPEISWS